MHRSSWPPLTQGQLQPASRPSFSSSYMPPPTPRQPRPQPQPQPQPSPQPSPHVPARSHSRVPPLQLSQSQSHTSMTANRNVQRTHAPQPSYQPPRSRPPSGAVAVGGGLVGSSAVPMMMHLRHQNFNLRLELSQTPSTPHSPPSRHQQQRADQTPRIHMGQPMGPPQRQQARALAAHAQLTSVAPPHSQLSQLSSLTIDTHPSSTSSSQSRTRQFHSAARSLAQAFPVGASPTAFQAQPAPATPVALRPAAAAQMAVGVAAAPGRSAATPRAAFNVPPSPRPIIPARAAADVRSSQLPFALTQPSLEPAQREPVQQPLQRRPRPIASPAARPSHTRSPAIVIDDDEDDDDGNHTEQVAEEVADPVLTAGSAVDPPTLPPLEPPAAAAPSATRQPAVRRHAPPAAPQRQLRRSTRVQHVAQDDQEDDGFDLSTCMGQSSGAHAALRHPAPKRPRSPSPFPPSPPNRCPSSKKRRSNASLGGGLQLLPTTMPRFSCDPAGRHRSPQLEPLSPPPQAKKNKSTAKPRAQAAPPSHGKSAQGNKANAHLNSSAAASSVHQPARTIPSAAEKERQRALQLQQQQQQQQRERQHQQQRERQLAAKAAEQAAAAAAAAAKKKALAEAAAKAKAADEAAAQAKAQAQAEAQVRAQAAALALAKAEQEQLRRDEELARKLQMEQESAPAHGTRLAAAFARAPAGAAANRSARSANSTSTVAASGDSEDRESESESSSGSSSSDSDSSSDAESPPPPRSRNLPRLAKEVANRGRRQQTEVRSKIRREQHKAKKMASPSTRVMAPQPSNERSASRKRKRIQVDEEEEQDEEAAERPSALADESAVASAVPTARGATSKQPPPRKPADAPPATTAPAPASRKCPSRGGSAGKPSPPKQPAQATAKTSAAAPKPAAAKRARAEPAASAGAASAAAPKPAAPPAAPQPAAKTAAIKPADGVGATTAGAAAGAAAASRSTDGSKPATKRRQADAGTNARKRVEGATMRPAAAAAAGGSGSSAGSGSPASEPREAARQAPSDWHSMLQNNLYLPKLREGESFVPPSPISQLVDVDKEKEEVVDLLEEDDQHSHRYMSAAAYEELATQDEAANHELMDALKQCNASTLPADGLDPHLMDKCIREQTGGPHPHINVTKCTSPTHGTSIPRVKALKTFKKFTAIAFFGGRMMIADDHSEDNLPHGSLCISVRKEHLKQIGYDGPSITICSHSKGNFASMIRPPADTTEQLDPTRHQAANNNSGKRPPASKQSAPRSLRPSKVPQKPTQANKHANIKLCVYVDRRKGVLWLVLVTCAPIVKNDELLMVPGVGAWSCEMARRLIISGRVNHWIHARMAQLERCLLKHDRAEQGRGDQPLPRGAEAESIIKAMQTQDSAEVLTDDKLKEQFDVPLVTDTQPVPYRPVHIADVFDVADAYHLKCNRVAAGQEDLKAELGAMADYCPKELTSHNEKQSFEVDHEQLEWVLKHGYDAALIEPGEIIDMSESVRLITLPSQQPFGVFAKEDISPGTILYSYVGLVSRDKQHDTSYMYTIPPDVIPGRVLPQMSLDAKMCGGIGRLVNDIRYRKTSHSINVTHVWLFKDGMVHFVFLCSRRIKKGQELVTEYGDEYWAITSNVIRWEQHHFARYMMRRVMQLTAECNLRGIRTPKRPPIAMESTGAFRPKIVPYPKRRHDVGLEQRVDLLYGDTQGNQPTGMDTDQDDDDDLMSDEDECQEFKEQDRIVLHRLITRRKNDIDGVKQYMVQLSEGLYPGWYSAHNLSEDLSLQLPSFDARMDALEARGQPLPPVPDPPTRAHHKKPRVQELPDLELDDEEEDDAARSHCDSDDDSEYEPGRTDEDNMPYPIAHAAAAAPAAAPKNKHKKKTNKSRPCQRNEGVQRKQRPVRATRKK